MQENLSSKEEITMKDLILKLREIIYYLFIRWYIFLGVGIVAILVGFLYAKFNKPVYIATTTFVLEAGESSSSLGQYSGIASMVGIDLGGGGGLFQGDNILELYKSQRMIEAALITKSTADTNVTLVDQYLKMTNTKAKWEKTSSDLLKIDFGNTNQLNPNFQRMRDSIIHSIVNDINKEHLQVVKPDKKLSLINVSVKANDELFAKEFNNALVKEVNDFYYNTKTKKSKGNIAILQHKVDSVRAVMNGDISTAASVGDQTPNLNPTRLSQRTIPTQRSQFSAETNKAILGQLIQNLELSKMSLLKEAPLIQVVDQPSYPLPKNKMGKIISIILAVILFEFFTLCFLLIRREYHIIMKRL